MNSHRELEIGIVAYSPLGRGFFGGKGVEETMPNGSQLVMGQTTTNSQSFFFAVNIYVEKLDNKKWVISWNRQTIQGSMERI